MVPYRMGISEHLFLSFAGMEICRVLFLGVPYRTSWTSRTSRTDRTNPFGVLLIMSKKNTRQGVFLFTFRI